MNPVIDKYGTKRWINEEGLFHRTDGPAFEGHSGYKAWYLNGARHRADGPAVESPNKSNFWYLNGKRHRTDGPAIESADGFKSWYLNGVLLTKDLFLKLTKGPVKKLPLYLGLGFDQFISERLKKESNHCSINERKDIYVRIYGNVHPNRRNTSRKVL